MQDSLLSQLLAPPDQMGDPLAEMLQQQAREEAIVALSRAKSPDQAARATALARLNGLPPETIARNLERYEKMQRAADWSGAIRGNPALGAWLAQPGVAAIAADDHKGVAKVAETFDYGAWAKRFNVNPNDKLSPTEKPAPTLWNGVKGVIGSLFTGWDKTDAAQQIFAADRAPNFLVPRAGVPSINTPSGREARVSRGIRDFQSAQAREDALNPAYQSVIARGIYSGFQSAAAMAAPVAAGIVTRNPTIGLLAAGYQSGVPAYAKYRSRGASPNMALIGGAAEGGVEVATELLPMGFLVEKFGRIGAGKFIAGYLGRELPGELAATMAQDAIDTAIANPGKTWGDYWKERPNALLETAIATLTMSTLTAGSSGLTRRLARDQGMAVAAEADSEFLDELATRSADSKVRARDPDAFASLLAALGGDAVSENVHIDAEAVRQYLQSDDEYDRGFWEPLADQVAEAQATGGDVVIPAAHAVAHLSGTKAWSALREDMRLSPGGMSLREAVAFENDFSGSVEAAAGDATKRVEAERKSAEPRQRLYDSAYAKLTSAGFTPDAARLQAELIASRYVTRAARMGREVTGTEFDATTVNQVLPERLRPIVAAKSIDMVIAAMRRGRDPKAKRAAPSLLEWISAQGGIEDRGGDLRAMGADKWHRGKPGRRKLIRETNPDQTSMLGEDGQQNSNSPDELALRAQEAGYFLPGERPTVDDLLAAIGEEIRGNPRYAEETQPDAMRMAAQDLYQLLEQEGVDADTASDAEIKSFVQRYQDGAEGGKAFEQAPPVKGAAFKKWFGDSKVVDANGAPAVVYHGTAQSFEAFDAQRSVDGAFWFTNDRAAIESGDVGAAGAGVVVEAYLSLQNPAGWDEYDKLSTDELIGAGYDGLALPGERGEVTYVAFEPTQIKSVNNLGTFNATDARILHQSFMDGPRGRVTFTEGRNIVDLFEKRDLSTFIHESGHIWLEELRADALSEGAPDQIRADWQAVQDWFEANGHAIGDDGAIPTDAHELWARGIERFTMEGKAPSSALRRAFEAFRSWLLTIYQVVDNLRAPISPEVRDVMQRLLATDEEIADAAEEQKVGALFTDAAAAGMTEAEFAAYRAAADIARNEAHDALLYRTMAAVRAKRTKEYRDQRDAVRAEVAEDVDSRREFRALAMLRDKSTGLKINKQWLIDTYGVDALDLVPASVPPIYADRGVSADEIAEAAGFATGDEMIRTLMGVEARRKAMRAEKDRRTVRDSVVDEETDAIMADRYGDPLADGSIEREARELIHNDLQGEVIASELRALSKKRPNLQATPYQLAKRWAARKVSEGTVAEYTSRGAIQRFQRAARKAADAAEKAMLKGDVNETFRQKQAQMLNNALVAEATRAADAVESAVSRLSKLAKRRTIKSLDQDYLDQAHTLLENVELRQRTQVSIDRQGSFEAWQRERQAEGYDLIVPASFEASLGTTHYTRLSVEKLLGLDDAVRQIIHLGRLKQTLIDGREQRDFDAVVAEAVAAAGNLPPRPPSDRMEPGFGDRLKANVASMDAALLKLETVFDWLDGGKADGVFNRIAFRPIAEAQDRENAMLADYYGRIRDAMGSVPKDLVRSWADKVSAPELLNRETGNPFVLTRQELVSMALNMGNEGNIQRLTDGYGWNEQAVREVLNRELTAPEWQFVQKTWDIIDTLWPDIAAMERRINGVEPERVQATPFETPHGTFRGGYYPAIYDTAKDLTAEKQAAQASDKFGALYTRATTRAASTKERSAKVTRPIHLSLGVINRHLGEVIHDITHREAVMQADKFLSSQRVMRAVDQTLGPEIRKQFQPWLKFVANSWAMERSGNEGLGKFINKARANTTVVGMAWRASTILTQIAGYSNSFEYVGSRWVGEAIARTAANPIASFNFVMERSAEVRTRMDTLDRDIRLTINQMAGKRTPLSDAKRFMFHGIGYADRLVVVPTWIGAYNKALASGAAEQDAAYEADKAVRKSQGAGSPKDLAAVQRGTGKWGELLRIATMFYSYMSAYYQRQRTLGRDVAAAVRQKDVRATPRLVARAWWLIVVPPLLSELLAGRGPDDDEDWGYWAFKRMCLNTLGPLPFVRDISAPIWDTLDGSPTFGYSVTPLQRAGESFVKVAQDGRKLATGEDPKKPVRNALEATGYVTGMVPGQIATATQFLVDVGEGEQDPETFAEWYRGLTKGEAKPKEK